MRSRLTTAGSARRDSICVLLLCLCGVARANAKPAALPAAPTATTAGNRDLARRAEQAAARAKEAADAAQRAADAAKQAADAAKQAAQRAESAHAAARAAPEPVGKAAEPATDDAERRTEDADEEGDDAPADEGSDEKSGPSVQLDDAGAAQSSGAPDLGHLSDATRLRASKRVALRFPKNVYGTRALIQLIEGCAAEVERRHGRSHRLLVGDLSRPRGGFMPPHEGHQNGREADIGFYLRSGTMLPGLWRVSPDALDADRTLTYLTCFIDSGRLLRAFLDRRLQRPLVHAAKRRGWSPARIARTFSYPRPGRERVGLVQHRRHHDNHLHVRLRCAPHEQGCVDKPYGRARRMAMRGAVPVRIQARHGKVSPKRRISRRGKRSARRHVRHKAQARGKAKRGKQRHARAKASKRGKRRHARAKASKRSKRRHARAKASKRSKRRHVRARRNVRSRGRAHAAAPRGHRRGGGARRD